ncbi:MAG: 30S ribosome-binding factor RbfA [Bdellovibrionales bacterium]|nr:30S ribosome-binding factor RbfA [Bdellovibrionales bacterium]
MREVLATRLLRLSDPRLELVTITSVYVSPDLRHAKVYWSALEGREKKAEILRAFKSASGLLRREIGKSLSLKSVPELDFYYDDTLDVLEETERLLDEVSESSADDINS